MTLSSLNIWTFWHNRHRFSCSSHLSAVTERLPAQQREPHYQTTPRSQPLLKQRPSAPKAQRQKSRMVSEGHSFLPGLPTPSPSGSNWQPSPAGHTGWHQSARSAPGSPWLRARVPRCPRPRPAAPREGEAAAARRAAGPGPLPKATLTSPPASLPGERQGRRHPAAPDSPHRLLPPGEGNPAEPAPRRPGLQGRPEGARTLGRRRGPTPRAGVEVEPRLQAREERPGRFSLTRILRLISVPISMAAPFRAAARPLPSPRGPCSAAPGNARPPPAAPPAGPRRALRAASPGPGRPVRAAAGSARRSERQQGEESGSSRGRRWGTAAVTRAEGSGLARPPFARRCCLPLGARAGQSPHARGRSPSTGLLVNALSCALRGPQPAGGGLLGPGPAALWVWARVNKYTYVSLTSASVIATRDCFLRERELRRGDRRQTNRK